jgi:hypothetical protein
MISAQLCIEEAVPSTSALARGELLAQRTTPQAPVTLYGAVLRGEALVLGAQQRARAALSPAARRGASELVRRQTGGVTLGTGDGIVYVALGLHDRSVLMTCPKLRILNRNVRGMLAGLRLAGVAAHYFGRDFLSIDARPGAYVAWDADLSGRVLLELFVAEGSSYLPPSAASGYPARTSDPLRGKTIITLGETSVHARGAALVEKIAQGYADGFAVDFRPCAASELADAQTEALRVGADPESDDGLCWSDPCEDAIGFVQAGVALDAVGKLQRVRVAGDFFQDRGAPSALERALVGVTPRERPVGQAIDTVYAHGPHELEGLRELASLREAILTAAARAPRP